MISNEQDWNYLQDPVSSEIYFQGEARSIRIHEWLKLDDIDEIYKIFQQKKDEKLSYTELYQLLTDFNIHLTEAEYKIQFCKIDQHRDSVCDLEEFISFLIFCFQQDDPLNQKEALIEPISSEPIIKDSNHRAPINAISLIKNSDENDNIDEAGIILTSSKDGLVNFWSPHFENIRNGKSKSHYLRYSPTWVLGVQALSDVRILVISSTERELRFHDITATNFYLRLVIRDMPYPICTMSYRFSSYGEYNSKLILGDLGGNIKILEFNPELRGPFQSKPGSALVELTWTEILKGKLVKLKGYEYNNLFTEDVKKVFYSSKFEMLYAGAEFHGSAARSYQNNSGVLAIDSRGSKTLFHSPMGVSTFYVLETESILVTGGPDTQVRIWDPFISSKPSAVLTGHHSGIVFIFIQRDEKLIYSVDFTKIIKIWNITDRSLLQTYSDLILIVPNENQLCFMYNNATHELLVAGRKLVAIKCCPTVRLDFTEGNTHAGPISVVLYNTLFENVVTCGLDSYIIVWDPWTGKRQLIIKKCHTALEYGEKIDVEITAACFDPKKQLLITGARNGTLKVWNYNNAACIRNMSIETDCEVTAIVWVPDRILAMGWNRHITEFADVRGEEYSEPKNWQNLHDDDITAAAYSPGETLVTGTYSGELIFWKLETGQPYRKFLTHKPNEFEQLVITQNKNNFPDLESALKRKYSRRSLKNRKSNVVSKLDSREKGSTQSVVSRNQSQGATSFSSSSIFPQKPLVKKLSIVDVANPVRTSKLSIRSSKKIKLPPEPVEEHFVSGRIPVQAIIILSTRPISKLHGSVFVALENGVIQIYSRHQNGGYLGEFFATHKTGDCVTTMTTDSKNKYLFTGTGFGYVKIWLLQNFFIPDSDKKHIPMPKLRLQFIFLSHDKFPGKAKRMIKRQPNPILLNSYKAHIPAITSINYIESSRIILTGSTDLSSRLWSLGGRYLGTLGSQVKWNQSLSPSHYVDENEDYRIPPEIRKIASSTTLKVLNGKFENIKWSEMTSQSKTAVIVDDTKSASAVSISENNKKCYYGKTIKEPYLGKHFAFEPSGRLKNPPVLDIESKYIPVYSHLPLHKANSLIECPPFPKIIKQTKKLEFKEYYNKPKKMNYEK